MPEYLEELRSAAERHAELRREWLNMAPPTCDHAGWSFELDKRLPDARQDAHESIKIAPNSGAGYDTDKISLLIPVGIGCLGIGAIAGYAWAVWWLS